MNRREFLTLSLVGGSSLLIPNLITPPKFNPEFEYGRCIPYTGRYSEVSELALKILHDDARKVLPKGTYYEIRGSIPMKRGRDKVLAWYKGPYMEYRSQQKMQVIGEGSCLFISGHYA